MMFHCLKTFGRKGFGRLADKSGVFIQISHARLVSSNFEYIKCDCTDENSTNAPRPGLNWRK
ncbi:LOW QUALITY PROTEIN: hypothetical protein NC652_024444 [Populus alba x Populus x berolinensis]|nr:LOW QUALITY PROTEIN: hypothetical protein NC652_024444 [Populus alba x Populus x berolinensis]